MEAIIVGRLLNLRACLVLTPARCHFRLNSAPKSIVTLGVNTSFELKLKYTPKKIEIEVEIVRSFILAAHTG